MTTTCVSAPAGTSSSFPPRPPSATRTRQGGGPTTRRSWTRPPRKRSSSSRSGVPAAEQPAAGRAVGRFAPQPRSPDSADEVGTGVRRDGIAVLQLSHGPPFLGGERDEVGVLPDGDRPLAGQAGEPRRRL